MTMVANPGSVFTRKGDRELEMTRVFSGTPEQVFKAWTDCEALKRWWGPRMWPTEYCTIDLRVGGAWHYCMREVGGTGNESWGKAIYREIAPPSRLAYTDYFSDKDGAENPPPMDLTLTFEPRGGKTLMTGRSVFSSPEHLEQVLSMGMEAGMNETLDRLDEYLAG
jgi:uncharacterized protein YndB with AHSA1/START domain